MGKRLINKIVNVSCWNSRMLNYMGKIELSSIKLGKKVGRQVRVIVEEI